MFCVLATDDDPHAKHDATHDGDHLASRGPPAPLDPAAAHGLLRGHLPSPRRGAAGRQLRRGPQRVRLERPAHPRARRRVDHAHAPGPAAAAGHAHRAGHPRRDGGAGAAPVGGRACGLPAGGAELPRRGDRGRRPQPAARARALRRPAGRRDADLGGQGLAARRRALRPISRITATARGMSERTLHEHRAGRAARRAARAGRHLRHDAQPPGGRLRQPAAVRGQRGRTSCAPRWRSYAPRSTSRCRIPTPASASCAPWPTWCTRPTTTWSASSRACWRWPAARAGSSIRGPPTSQRRRGRPGARGCGRGAGPAFAPEGPLRLDAVLRSAPVTGDPMLLERLAENLVENAVRYNAALGWVRVRTDVEGAAAVLVVENPGPVVPPHEAPLLVEPFRRLEASRARATGGYGLGLASRACGRRRAGGAGHAHRPGEGGLEVRVSVPAATGTRSPVLTEVLDPA